MNFSPFVGNFPFSVTSTSSTQENRYSTTNFQTIAPTTKFRAELLANVTQSDNNPSNIISSNITNKYTSHSTTTGGNALNYGSITYNTSQQQADTSKNTTNFAQITTSSATSQQSQSILQSELSQDLSSLLQSTDAKRVLQNVQNVNSSWQSLTNTSVADYLSHLPASMPLSLHHFLKYSTENIKKESTNPIATIDLQSQHSTATSLNLNNLTSSLLPTSTSTIANILNQQTQQQQSTQQTQQTQQNQQQQQQQQQQQNTINQQQNPQAQIIQTTTVTVPTPIVTTKKKKKKKPPKEKKPRPKAGEIRLKTALDGSTLFVCPECTVAYPEKEILESHMVVHHHSLERKFVCDICSAALKRKDHLTRHKQSHNPERPFVCTICLKGTKRHVCVECNKGFYRKDHLRKHTRSHIARRVKAELSQQNNIPIVPTLVGQSSSVVNQVQTLQTNEQLQAQQVQSLQQQLHQLQQQQSQVHQNNQIVN